MNIAIAGSINKKIAFSGQKKIVDNTGEEKQKFFLPYDHKNFKAFVELYNVEKIDGKYKVIENPDKPVASIELGKVGAAEVAVNEILGENNQYAYRFRLTPIDKDGKPVKDAKDRFVFDSGTVTNIFDDNKENKYNLVFNNRATVNKAGKMQLIMLDQYYPGMERSKNHKGEFEVNQELRTKALNSVRTHTNKLGGGLLGVIAKLPELEKEGYTRIVGMPITKDTVSSHLYWTQNAFQLSPQLGTMVDFKEMQTKMFKHGINWVSDAALVNEGLQGVHFSNLLKWGKESPFYNWFKVTGDLTVGIFPENTEHVKYKLVNAPFKLDDKLSPNSYNPQKPTFIQFYDDRLASDEQKTDNNLIETYAKNNTSNTYEITTHNDTVNPYSFEVDPIVLRDNVRTCKATTPEGTRDFQSINAIRQIMKFPNFNIDSKVHAAGIENWDGNTDIAKLNFYWGNTDNKALKGSEEEMIKAKADAKQGILQVQDYAITSGKYWTKLSADIQLSYVANLLKNTLPTPEKYAEKIQKEVDAGNLPKSLNDKEIMNSEVLNNIFEKNYNLPRLQTNNNSKEYVLREVLDFPLETIPASNDVLGVLTSPYIVKRATNESQLGVSRLDLYKAGNKDLPVQFQKVQEQADSLYSNELAGFAMSVLKNSNKNLFKKNEKDKVTELGKYAIAEVMPDIMKYALVKGLDESAKIGFKEDGSIDFSETSPEDISLASIGIKADSPEEEAELLVDTLRRGIRRISPENKAKLTEAISKRLKNADLDAYKVAEAIIDRTESGMGWRIDAAKDVASVDAVRHGEDAFSTAWDSTINFWKAFNQTVKKVNPHVYTTAEITDLGGLTRINNPSNGRFENDVDAETKFIEETGITTTANYSYFYSLIPQMYAKSFETGEAKADAYTGTDKPGGSGENKMWPLQQKIDGVYSGWKENPGFLFQSPLDGVIHSYTFVGNHDKPRLLHMLALNPELFYSHFSKENDEHRNIAAEVLEEKDLDQIDFDKTSGRAIAMGQKLRQAFAEAANKGESIDSTSLKVINNSIAKLAGGEFKGKNFDADAFGSRPFEIVIADVLEEANYLGLELNTDKKRTLESEVFGTIIKPAMDKYLTIYKTLVTLPGDVTDFAGDKIASTGYESKAKNYTQQNRNTIRWEWIDDEKDASGKHKESYRDYVKKFNDDMNNILNLRNRPELSALNDGIPVSLTSEDEKFYSLLRYNDKGSTVLSIYNAGGATVDNTKAMDRSETSVYRIKLSQSDKPRQGLPGGLVQNTRFKNADKSDTSTYKVVEENGEYFLKRDNAQGENLGIVMRPSDNNALVLYKVD